MSAFNHSLLQIHYICSRSFYLHPTVWSVVVEKHSFAKKGTTAVQLEALMPPWAAL